VSSKERGFHGRSIVKVRCDVEDIMAYQWDFQARHLEKRRTVNKMTVERVNNHSKIVSMEMVMPSKRLRNRDLVMRLVWKKLSKDTSIFVLKSVEHPDFPVGMSDTVRLHYFSAIKARQDSHGFTTIEFLLSVEDSGRAEAERVIGKHAYAWYKRRLISYGLHRTYDMQQ
jgi:hypothetical protein